VPDSPGGHAGDWGDLDRPPPERAGPSEFSVTLACVTGLFGAGECALAPGSYALLLLVVVVAGTCSSFLLRSAPPPYSRISALPSGVALLLPLVGASAGPLNLLLGGGAGLLTLLAVGAPDTVPRPLRAADIGRAAALPAAGALVVGLVYEVPLGALNQPAVFLVVALGMLAALAIYLSRLAPASRTAAG
jgi:hypothetical protein